MTIASFRINEICYSIKYSMADMIGTRVWPNSKPILSSSTCSSRNYAQNI